MSKLDKIRGIIEDYMDGPLGEPNLADAHDYLCAIENVLNEDDAEENDE